MQLDELLSLGWFRMQQTIFTTGNIFLNGRVYDVIWLRVRLDDFGNDKKYKIVAAKNKRFRTEIKMAVINPVHENLFLVYKENILFEGAASLHSLLYGISERNVYNTYMIEVYDSDALIGTGYFDLGNTSGAGICSVYHPAYKKFSLGKYMIYEKMQYCKRENFTYFYPGYFLPANSAFDYKLEIGKPAIEYFDAIQNQWYPLY